MRIKKYYFMDKKMKDFLNQDTSYKTDKAFLANLLAKYNEMSWDKMEEFHDNVSNTARSKNWSRRKLYYILDELLKENGKEYSENLFNVLNNYLENLEGSVSWDAIVRLNGDPEDKSELSTYVRGGKWKDEDFYSAS
jgi:hypothetical protein